MGRDGTLLEVYLTYLLLTYKTVQVASTIAFLAGSGASFITGTIFGTFLSFVRKGMGKTGFLRLIFEFPFTDEHMYNAQFSSVVLSPSKKKNT